MSHTMKGQGRRTATAAQIIEAGKLLDEHFDKEKKEYKGDWDDDRIAQAVMCKPSSIGNIRRQLGMNMIATHTGSTAALQELRARVEELEKDLVVLRPAIADLALMYKYVTAICRRVGARSLGEDNYKKLIMNLEKQYPGVGAIEIRHIQEKKDAT